MEVAFNVKTCKVLHVGKNNPHIPYTTEGRQLEQTVSEKGLGITMDKEQKFHMQTSVAVKKKSKPNPLVDQEDHGNKER